MIAIFYLVLQILKLYSYVVIVNVVLSWLIAFSVLNTQNRFVYSILELSYRLTDPILNKIRRFLPNLGSLDISPRMPLFQTDKNISEKLFIISMTKFYITKTLLHQD